MQFQTALMVEFADQLVKSDPRIALSPLRKFSPSDEYFALVDIEPRRKAGLDVEGWPTAIRSPRDRNSGKPWIPTHSLDSSITHYITAFGTTGWTADGLSKWVGFDFDGPNHIDGCTKEQLDGVFDAVKRIDDPNLTIRTSKSGQGYHIIYTFPEPMKTPTGKHHERLASVVLDIMSKRSEFNFSSVVDCGGGGKVLFHWARTIAANGLTIL